MDNRPIGIFDSGVGGLTVAGEVMKALPNEEIIYFGDTARVPYGSKSRETVMKYSIQACNFLLTQNVKAIIVACNTACSNCFDDLMIMFGEVPFVDVVTPGVKMCLEVTKKNCVGVIGTEATIRSGAYKSLITELRPGTKVYSKPCPLFVPLAEEGWTNNTVASLTAEMYLQEFVDKEIDTLILGCTHYPLLLGCITNVARHGIKIVNPAEGAAADMMDFLETNEMLREDKEPPSHTFYVSDSTSKFNRICAAVLNRDYTAHKIDIEKY